MDGEGLLPDALDAAAVRSKATALYCVPTMQNPTAASMSVQRRKALIEVARRRGLTILEDEAYAALQESSAPSLAELAPDITYCIVGLAKLIAPSMRVSYVIGPDRQKVGRLGELLRITMQTAAPLEAALATRLIETGLLQTLIGQIGDEARLRQTLARRLLSGYAITAPDSGLFVWLTLPAQWINAGFTGRLRHEGVWVADSSSFVVEGAEAPAAVRIATGAARTRADLEGALTKIGDLLGQNATLLNPID
jgi:DNA-binding transcriptional MocR family regulator